ncbi:MAG: RluA family pseudouridine synthase [Clostridia bacterium]|nr:RluA family pseudouridine synthase [Clostridia bacterium]
MQTENFFVKDKNLPRLDLFLQQKYKDKSRSHIKNWITNNCVFVNNKVAKKSGQILKENDQIMINFPPNIETKAMPENLPLEIVFQDKDLAVVNKPQGMVVHSGNGNFAKTLVNALLFHIKDLSGINGVLRPGIVHRLDKNTAGLLLVAKNDFAHINLAKQIENKTCQRKYLAILEGNIKEDSGVVETHIARSLKNRTLMTVCDSTKGKLAITEYKVLERFENFCLVEFNLKTGRTHQIRVHCKEILHHSIVGDIEYGGSVCKLVYKSDEKSLGQYLVAYKIKFNHPTTKKDMEFVIDLPNYFIVLLEKLRKNF